MSVVNNRLEKFNESLKCIKLAYSLIDSSKKKACNLIIT